MFHRRQLSLKLYVIVPPCTKLRLSVKRAFFAAAIAAAISAASDEVTGAIIAIEGPKSLQLSDATAIVGGVQKRLTDKVEIIWGLNFTDEDVLRATVLLAIQQK